MGALSGIGIVICLMLLHLCAVSCQELDHGKINIYVLLGEHTLLVALGWFKNPVFEISKNLTFPTFLPRHFETFAKDM